MEWVQLHIIHHSFWLLQTIAHQAFTLPWIDSCFFFYDLGLVLELIGAPLQTGLWTVKLIIGAERGDGQREKNPVRERRHRPKELSWRNERQEHLPQVIIFFANWSLIDKPGRFEPSSSVFQWAKLSFNPVGIFIFPRLHIFQVVSFTALFVIVAFATWTLSG